MSAVDSTSKHQFGWLEETNVRHYPAGNVTPSITEGSTNLHHIDRNDPDGRNTNATMHASWSDIGPRPFTASQREAGADVDESGQGQLLDPGRHNAPVMGSLYSTKAGRLAGVRGVGIMANITEAHAGGTPMRGSTDLSGHSAPMVSKLTGQEHAQTNTISFGGDMSSSIPHEHQMGTRVKPTSNRRSGGTETITNRWVPEPEVAQGSKRVIDAAKANRAPRKSKDTQLELF